MTAPEHRNGCNGNGENGSSVALLKYATAIVENVRRRGDTTRALIEALLTGWTQEGKTYRQLGELLEPYSNYSDTEQTRAAAVKMLLDDCDIPSEERAEIGASHRHIITPEEARRGGCNTSNRYRFGQVDFTKRKEQNGQIDWTIYDAQLVAFVAEYRVQFGQDVPIRWTVIAEWMNAHPFPIAPPKPFTHKLCRSQWVNRRRYDKRGEEASQKKPSPDSKDHRCT